MGCGISGAQGDLGMHGGVKMSGTQGLKTILLGSVGVLALSIGPVFADELTDLKSKVNQQDNVIQQLQQRLDQIEKEKTQDTDQALQSDPDDTQAQVSQGVRVAPSSEAGPADAVVGGAFPGSFKLPGSDTSIGIHGFVQADFIYDLNQPLGDTFQSSKLAATHAAAQHEGGQFRFSSRQSRLSFESRTPTDYGMLRTVIVGDFLGGSAGPGILGSGGGGYASAGFGNAFVTNSYVFRLRQAFAEFGPIRAGQDYSNFTDADALPQLFDGFGPAGQTKVRQTQLRYTNSMGPWTFTASAENPQSDFSASTDASFTPTAGSYGGNNYYSPAGASGAGLILPGKELTPDFTAAVKFADFWGYLKLAGLFRSIGVDTGAPFALTTISAAGAVTTSGTIVRQRSETEGGGGVLSGVFNLNTITPWFGKDQFGFNSYYGSGLGRYTNYAGNYNDGAALKAFGTAGDYLATNPSEGGFVWYQHNWTDTLRSNFVFGMQHNHWSATTATSTAQVATIKTIHANLMWSPVKPVTMGFEVMFADKDFRTSKGVGTTLGTGTYGDTDATDTRIQASLQILF
jgi:hypothetical protein